MNILLVCAAGMSTSLLVTKMEKSAQEQGKNRIGQRIRSEAGFCNLLSEKTDDVLLRLQILLQKYQLRFQKVQLFPLFFQHGVDFCKIPAAQQL